MDKDHNNPKQEQPTTGTTPPLDTSPEAMEAERQRQAEELRQATIEELRPYFLDPREDYPTPWYMLEFQGVPFSPLGGIQAISGQKKNGKTFVLTQLMAAMLAQGSPRAEEYLAGLTCPQRTIDHLGHLPRVLFVDTEMEKLNSAKVLRRVHWLCGWDMRQPNDRFNVLWLRSVRKDDEKKAWQMRRDLTFKAIDLLQPDAVFIDGIRDIARDFNDSESSSELVLDLMAMAEERQMCVWSALHMNPRPKNDDESKMRGHLGTELGNKVTDTLVSIKKKQGADVLFTVQQQDARDKDMDDWQFQVCDVAGSLGIPKIIGVAQRTEPTADNEQDILKWIHEAGSHYEWPMSKNQIKSNIFAEIGGQKNHSIQDLDMTVAINLGYLVQSTLKKNGAYMWQPPEDLPF